MADEKFLGMIEPSVEEDVVEDAENNVPVEEPEPPSITVPDQSMAEPEDEEVVEEPEPEDFNLDEVVSKFSPQAKEDDDRAALQRELAVLKAQLQDRNELYDKAILGKRDEPEPDPLADLESPEVGRLLQEAIASDDPAKLAKLNRYLSEKVANQSASRATQDIAKRLEAIEQNNTRAQQVQEFKASIGGALNHLQNKGKVCQALVAEFQAKGENSQLWKTWVQAPEIMRSSQLMAVAGVGLARLLEDAAGTSNLRADVETPAVEAAPVVPKDSSTGTRPKASRGESKLKPTKKESDDGYESVMAHLKGAGSGAGAWLNTF